MHRLILWERRGCVLYVWRQPEQRFAILIIAVKMCDVVLDCLNGVVVSCFLYVCFLLCGVVWCISVVLFEVSRKERGCNHSEVH